MYATGWGRRSLRTKALYPATIPWGCCAGKQARTWPSKDLLRVPPVWKGVEALGYSIVCTEWGVTEEAPTAFLRMQQEMGTKPSTSLFQQQETTTSERSKSKSDGNAALCQALSLLEPAPSQRYKNTVLQQHLGNTDPGIAQNPCPQRAGQPTPPPPLATTQARLGIAQQLGTEGPGEGNSVSLNYLYKNSKGRYKTGEERGSWGCKRLWVSRVGAVVWTSEKMTVPCLSVSCEQC